MVGPGKGVSQIFRGFFILQEHLQISVHIDYVPGISITLRIVRPWM